MPREKTGVAMPIDQTDQIPLTERAEQLLKVLVESYIRAGQPVGSRSLARAAGLDVSPATVRNVMADLAEMGLVHSPHTSAGRVPTTLGYRTFVDRMLKVCPLRQETITELKEGLDPSLGHHDLVETASSLISGISHLAGIVTVPRSERAVLRRIEFLEMSEGRTLVILVTNRQEVQNLIIKLDRPYTASELEQIANYLNERYAGKDLQAVRQGLLEEMDGVRRDMNRLMEAAVELGEKVFSAVSKEREDYIVAGQTELMRYGDLCDMNKLRRLFEAFNRKRDIITLLDKCIHADGVQIFIGHESDYKPLNECSVVSAPYMVGEDVVGVLAVVGPTRMAYERVVPLVEISARLLGSALKLRE